MYDSRLARRRFLQASTAAVLGIASRAGFSMEDIAEASDTELTWLVRVTQSENTWEQKVAIPNFEKANPGIKVNPVIISNPTQNFDLKLSNMLIAGSPPDVWSQWGPSDFVDYSWRGLTADMSSYLTRDRSEYKDFYPGAMNYGKWNGKQTGIPLMLGGTYCFYNMDLLDKAGVPHPPASWEDKSWNWNTMVSQAKKLTTNFDNPSKAIYGVYADLGCLDEFVWLWGGDVWDKDVYTGNGVPHQSHWNSPEAIAAIQALADLTYVDKVAPSPAVQGALSGSSGNDPFLTGRIAFRLTGIWGFYTYNTVPFKWGAAALPGMQSNKGGIYADPWLLSSRSKNPDAAWKFIKYLTTTQGAREYMQATNTPVPHTPLLNQWRTQFKNMKPQDMQTVYDGALKHGYLSIQNDLVAYDRIRTIINNDFSPVLEGKAKAKDVAPQLDKALAKLFSRLRP
jgi:multiple sugar transport system substrate-binding protein